MSSLRFDMDELVAGLQRLASPLRAAFAASCAQRLLPAYAHFAGRTGRGAPDVLRSMLDRLWRDLEGARMTSREIQGSIDRCEEQIEITAQPDGDSLPGASWSDMLAALRARSVESVASMEGQAEDAASALAYALRCRRHGDPREAAWAAKRAYEAVSGLLRSRADAPLGLSGASLGPPSQLQGLAQIEWAQAHPLTQAELGRQQRDLQELLGVRGPGGAAVATARLRERARAEASSTFG